ILDAQSSARGYIVTTDDDYQDQFKSSQNDVRDSLKEIRKLTQDNAAQQQTLDTLEPDVDHALAQMKETMELCKVHGSDEALKRLRAGGQNDLLDNIRRRMIDMASVEKKLLSDRTEDMTESAYNTKLTIVFGTILALVFVSLCGFLITRDITGPIRVLVRAADNLARGRFDAVPRFHSRDEFEDLSLAFNQMGSSMRDLTEQVELDRARLIQLEHLVDALRLDLEKVNSRASDLLSAARHQIICFEESPTPVATAADAAGHLAETADQLSVLARAACESGKQASQASEGTARGYQELQTALTALSEKIKSTA